MMPSKVRHSSASIAVEEERNFGCGLAGRAPRFVAHRTGKEFNPTQPSNTPHLLTLLQTEFHQRSDKFVGCRHFASFQLAEDYLVIQVYFKRPANSKLVNNLRQNQIQKNADLQITYV